MGGRIVIATFGSYGDVHPFIALAVQLRARGFAPVIATMAEYHEKVTAEGIDFHAVRPAMETIMRDSGIDPAKGADALVRRGPNFIFDTMIAPYLTETYPDLAEIVEGAEMVVASSFAVPARFAAEAFGVPLASVLLSPVLFFSAHEPIHINELAWLPWVQQRIGPRRTRWLLDAMAEVLRRRQRAANDFLGQIGLPPLSRDVFMQGPLHADLLAGLYSPVLGEVPPDAPSGAFVAGFTFHDSERGEPATLSPALAAFLDAGPPPVVFTLGSFVSYGGADFYRDSVAAARRIGRRAVLLVAPGQEAAIAAHAGAAADVHVAGYVPHSLIFPRAAAIVHHGGIGTVGQALRAGRPQLVCPMFGDQPDNAERLVRLGVARRLDRRRYDAARAASALADLLAGDHPARAVEVGRRVATEDGAAVLAGRIAASLARASGDNAA
jgi:rhamnosyltransferase subunit B